jgi:hypothetical protein
VGDYIVRWWYIYSFDLCALRSKDVWCVKLLFFFFFQTNFLTTASMDWNQLLLPITTTQQHLPNIQYEYGMYSTYASDHEERKKQILPLWETIDLQDYRLRHATYNSDIGLQNLR